MINESAKLARHAIKSESMEVFFEINRASLAEADAKAMATASSSRVQEIESD